MGKECEGRGSNTALQMFCFNQEQSQRRVLLIEEILEKVCVLMGMIEREKIACAGRNKIKEGEEALRRLRWWDSKHKEDGWIFERCQDTLPDTGGETECGCK